MRKSHKTSTIDWKFLAQESTLLLLWSYVILVSGSYDALFRYELLIPSVILAGVLFVIWLLPKLFRGEGFSPSGLELGIILFLGTQVISLAFSQDVRRSVVVVGQYIIYFLIFYRVLDLLQNGWTASSIERTFLIVGGIVLTFALFEHISNYLAWQTITEGLPHVPEFKNRLYAVFGNAPLLAAFTNLLIPFALVRTLSAPNITMRISWGLYTLIALLVEFFSDTRGGYLGTAAIFGIVIALWIGLVSGRVRKVTNDVWQYLKSRPVIMTFVLVIVSAPVIWLGVKAIQFQGDATHGPLLSSRSTFWRAAWVAIKSDPLLGSGPGTYSTILMDFNSVPPYETFMHAHNMLINFASESGLLGLAGVLAFGGLLIKRVLRTWQDLEKEELIRWIAVCACLLGHLVHTIADHFLYPMVTGIPLVVMLAILMNVIPNKTDSVTVSKRFHALWLVVPALVVGLLGIFSLQAYSDFNQGLTLAGNSDWDGAVGQFDSAAQKDPWLAHYWLSSGYTYGILAKEGDGAVLEKAISNFEQGIAIEPIYSLNHNNLGMLYWVSGQSEKAIDQLKQAVSVAPREDTYWLNLGFLYEESNQGDLAREAYRKALGLKPENALSTYWDQSEIRRGVQRDWLDYTSEHPWMSKHEAMIEQGRTALLEEDFQQAEDLFIHAQAMRPYDSLSYLGLAELAIARGDLEMADRYLKTALSMQSLTYDDKVWPLLAWAQVGLMQGEEEIAFERFRFLYEMVTEYPIAGWGQKGRTEYGWWVFRRRGLPLDVLPQVIRIDLTPKLASGLLPLVEMYEERGEYEVARDVEATLLPAIP